MKDWQLILIGLALLLLTLTWDYLVVIFNAINL